MYPLRESFVGDEWIEMEGETGSKLELECRRLLHGLRDRLPYGAMGFCRIRSQGTGVRVELEVRSMGAHFEEFGVSSNGCWALIQAIGKLKRSILAWESGRF